MNLKRQNHLDFWADRLRVGRDVVVGAVAVIAAEIVANPGALEFEGAPLAEGENPFSNAAAQALATFAGVATLLLEETNHEA